MVIDTVSVLMIFLLTTVDSSADIALDLVVALLAVVSSFVGCCEAVEILLFIHEENFEFPQVFLSFYLSQHPW